MPLPDRPVDGEDIATDWGQDVHDRVFAAKGCWLHGTLQSVDATLEKLNLDNADDDPGSWLDAANDRAEVPTGAEGLYHVSVDFNSVNGDDGDLVRGFLYLNGANVGAAVGDSQDGVHIVFTLYKMLDLTAGDLLECYAQIRGPGGGSASVLVQSFRTLRATDALGA